MDGDGFLIFSSMRSSELTLRGVKECSKTGQGVIGILSVFAG